MMPRLGEKYEVEIKTVSKPKAEFHTDEYYALDLPAAPAIMVGEEIIVEGSDVDENTLEAAICGALGLPSQEAPKKSIRDKLFGK
jgi:hypothetical protein